MKFSKKEKKGEKKLKNAPFWSKLTPFFGNRGQAGSEVPYFDPKKGVLQKVKKVAKK